MIKTSSHISLLLVIWLDDTKDIKGGIFMADDTKKNAIISSVITIALNAVIQILKLIFGA